MSNSLRPHEPQHARPPCPSPTPGVHPNSCPSSQWCHLTISSSVAPFSSCLQYFPASRSFQMSQFFASGGQSLEFQLQHQPFQWIFRTDFLYDWPVRPPCSPRDSQGSSPVLQLERINSSTLSFLYSPTLTSTWLLEKPKLWLDRPLLAKKRPYFSIHCLGWSYLTYQWANVF